jgi:hypothetical protein
VADETGTLKEGEVFCQYQQDDKSQPRVLVSEVLVCRAPACKLFHSGLMNEADHTVHPGRSRQWHSQPILTI